MRSVEWWSAIGRRFMYVSYCTRRSGLLADEMTSDMPMILDAGFYIEGKGDRKRYKPDEPTSFRGGVTPGEACPDPSHHGPVQSVAVERVGLRMCWRPVGE